MEFVFLLLVALVIWLYLWAKDLDKNSNPVKKYSHEMQEKGTRKLRSELTTQKTTFEKDITLHSFNYISSPPKRESSSPPRRIENAENKSQQRQHILKENTPSLNTGIAELDGPGMFQRLTRLGPSASAVYLLYSVRHDAYKVGYCDPKGIANRIKQIRPEVPDVKLDGTAVFTSTQNAFNAEQRILDKHSSDRYSGIKGRWSGSTEWITRRPTGKPYLTPPETVEANYRKDLEAPTERPIEDDIYTVYLMESRSRGMFKASWCKTENLEIKVRNAQKDIASDAKVISRFPIQNIEKARAVAIDINKKAGTFWKEGRKESYEWASNPSYLNQFKDWGSDGKKIL